MDNLLSETTCSLRLRGDGRFGLRRRTKGSEKNKGVKKNKGVGTRFWLSVPGCFAVVAFCGFVEMSK